jgi:hypothetical protein
LMLTGDALTAAAKLSLFLCFFETQGFHSLTLLA